MMHDLCEERAELSGKIEDLNITIDSPRYIENFELSIKKFRSSVSKHAKVL